MTKQDIMELVLVDSGLPQEDIGVMLQQLLVCYINTLSTQLAVHGRLPKHEFLSIGKEFWQAMRDDIENNLDVFMDSFYESHKEEIFKGQLQ